jgi:hypothetical protein
VTDEPPPLTVGSDASKILLRLWRGERLVHHAPPAASWSGSFDAHVATATTVAGQLRLRAGLRIYVIGDDEQAQAALHRSLRVALPTTPIGLPHGRPAVVPDSDHIPTNVNDEPGYIYVCGPWHQDPGGVADLLIVLAGTNLSSDHLVRYLVGSRQLLILGANEDAQRLRLADRTDLEVPVDVTIAGGAFG